MVWGTSSTATALLCTFNQFMKRIILKMQLMIAWQKLVCSGGSDLADMAMRPYPAILTAGN